MIYYATYLISIIFAYLAEHGKTKKTIRYIFIIFSMVPLILLATLRDITVGTDIKNYVIPIYNMVRNSISFSKYFYVQPYEQPLALMNFSPNYINPVPDPVKWFLYIH